MISKHSIFNICNFYILIWCLYMFHWYITGIVPVLETYANVFLGIGMIISVVAFIKVLGDGRMPILLRSLIPLIVTFTLYGMISVISDEAIYIRFGGNTRINNGSYMIAALRTFLPIFTFFLFTKMGYVNEKMMKMWFFVFAAIASFSFVSQSVVSYGYQVEGLFTNNSGYLFVALIPFVCLWHNKPIVQNVLLVILMIMIIASLKRGAILSAMVGVIFIITHNDREKKKLLSIIKIILLAIGVIVVAIVSYDLYQGSEVFQERIEATLAGSDSNRSVLREEQLSVFFNKGNLSIYLFGFGADGTLKISENYAHDDWREMLVDQGFVGLFFYLLFWIIFYKTWRKSKKTSKIIFNIMGLLFIMGLIKTIFSMWYSTATIFTTLPIGYCLAKMNNGITNIPHKHTI